MLNDKNYKTKLQGFSVVEILGEGCPNCLTMLPILNNVCQKINIPFYSVLISDQISLMIKEYKVKSVPTILLLHNDLLIDKVTGFQPEEILELWIDYKMKAFL